jgi:hypothetical protein
MSPSWPVWKEVHRRRERLPSPYTHQSVPKCMSIQRFKSPPFQLATAMFLCTILAGSVARAQTSLTWEQVRSKFEAVNPALKADAYAVDELRAEEITAYLRPNPQFNFSLDGTQFPENTPYRPFVSEQEQSSFSYLHEREHKRELRRESAVEGTPYLPRMRGEGAFKASSCALYPWTSALLLTICPPRTQHTAQFHLQTGSGLFWRVCLRVGPTSRLPST